MNNNEFEYEDDEKKISQYYTQRRLEKNRLERKIRKGQIWFTRFRVLARLIIIIAIILAGKKLLNVHQWYLEENIFNSVNNPHIEILNNKIIPSNKILMALRRTEIPKVPIYRLETDSIKNNIMKLDPVENVFIRRFWFPARLQIIVQERVPIITISPNENVAPIAFFARGGKLIGRDYMPLDKSFETILVLSYGTRGDDYRNWTNEKIQTIEKVAKAIEISASEKINYIDFRKPDDVFVKLNTTTIRLGVLDDTVFERIKRIPSILPQIKMLDKKIQYVDLRWKDANYIKLGN